MSDPTFALPEHAQRRPLNDEVHARPPVRLMGPHRIVFLAIRHEAAGRGAHRDAIRQLAQARGEALQAGDHAVLRLADNLRLKWEGHAEFSSYTFFREGESRLPPGEVLAEAGWAGIARDLPGEVFVAATIELARGVGDVPPPDAFRTSADTVVGGALAEGRGWAYTDFRIREDGFTHFLILARSDMGVGQSGRMVQRLLEIETYRMMALTAFPMARESLPELAAMETELGRIVERIAGSASQDETKLLDDLTNLAAHVERLQNATSFRFQASEAYDALVLRRIAELREVRIPGLQTIEEFMQRRLAPAMATCRSTSRRISGLAARVARASALLRTRVDIAREQQNQLMLAAMNRRSRLQLKLQQAVEGLSVVVITYYGSSLVGVVAKAVKVAGGPVNPEVASALSVPFIALAVFLAARGVRRAMLREDGPKGGA
ncbi:MAG: DUF3422 domain-containing protein [Betaproteobacteria bacterium]|nr:DUF3422 domain-containing protein [Betaproteobacteria bacterium]